MPARRPVPRFESHHCRLSACFLHDTVERLQSTKFAHASDPPFATISRFKTARNATYLHGFALDLNGAHVIKSNRRGLLGRFSMLLGVFVAQNAPIGLGHQPCTSYTVNTGVSSTSTRVHAARIVTALTSG